METSVRSRILFASLQSWSIQEIEGSENNKEGVERSSEVERVIFLWFPSLVLQPKRTPSPHTNIISACGIIIIIIRIRHTQSWEEGVRIEHLLLLITCGRKFFQKSRRKNYHHQASWGMNSSTDSHPHTASSSLLSVTNADILLPTQQTHATHVQTVRVRMKGWSEYRVVSTERIHTDTCVHICEHTLVPGFFTFSCTGSGTQSSDAFAAHYWSIIISRMTMMMSRRMEMRRRRKKRAWKHRESFDFCRQQQHHFNDQLMRRRRMQS